MLFGVANPTGALIEAFHGPVGTKRFLEAKSSRSKPMARQQIRTVGYFTFDVEDKAGEGARLLGRLKDAQVNLLSFVAFPTTKGRAQITVIPENAEAFAAAAKKVGLTSSGRKECFLVQGDDRVGAAHEVLNRLAEAKVSFTAGHACTAGGSFGMTLFVKPADVAAVAKALGA
jgi:hypothetical protein